MEKLRTLGKKIIPTKLFNSLSPTYHYLMAWLGSVWYRNPSKHLHIIGVTGTKGKSSVTEILSALLESGGYSTAVSGTVRFKIGDEIIENKLKQTMPGRFYLQSFLRRCVKKKVDFVIMEMTSEGAKQFRNKFIRANTLIYTNLEPEHIESHGGYENYRDAKLSIIRDSIVGGGKKDTMLVVNADDKEAEHFLNFPVSKKKTYSLQDAGEYELTAEDISFTWDGAEFFSPLSGEFNLYNLLGCLTVAKEAGVSTSQLQKAVKRYGGVPGRVERINEGQDYTVIVDYAHTPGSLEKLYETFAESRRICVLGNTGGGRDKWKRPAMGAIADRHCSDIILTNEDPYDEDPMNIVEEMKKGIKNTPCEIIMDRKRAIETAVGMAKTGDTVLITGKGTDPFIMGPKGTKTIWSDSEITREIVKARMEKTSHD